MFSIFSVNLQCDQSKHKCQLTDKKGKTEEKLLSHSEIQTFITYLNEQVEGCKIITPPTVIEHLKEVKVEFNSPVKINELIRRFFPNALSPTN